MNSYYATTRFYQNDTEFRCSWDLTATQGDPTEEETIEHLAAMLSDNYPETWNLDEDDQTFPSVLNLHGLSPKEFARKLVLNEEESQKRLGVTWEISTRWQEVDPDNWEHPCNI